jgi:hypothetical protein
MRGPIALSLVAACLLLSGCLTREERIAKAEAADDAACRAQPNVEYTTCRKLRMQYREQEKVSVTVGGGGGAVAPVPNYDNLPPMTRPQNTTCSRVGMNVVCNTF